MGGSSRWSAVWVGLQVGFVALFGWATATGRSTRPFVVWLLVVGVVSFVRSGRWRDRSVWFAIASLAAAAIVAVLLLIVLVQAVELGEAAPSFRTFSGSAT